jgi:hypothetical protein
MALCVLANGVLHRLSVGPGNAAQVAVPCATTKRLHAIFWGSPGIVVSALAPDNHVVCWDKRFDDGEGSIEIEAEAASWLTLRFDVPSGPVNSREREYIDKVSTLLNGTSCKRAGATRVDETVQHASGVPTQFADKILLASSHICRFDAADGESCCATRKPSKGRVEAAPASPGEIAMSIETIASKTSSPEPAWKQSAASFSTMMRYFQRKRAEFEWATDCDSQTMIARQ